jgi:hypothetical protein
MNRIDLCGQALCHAYMHQQPIDALSHLCLHKSIALTYTVCVYTQACNSPSFLEDLSGLTALREAVESLNISDADWDDSSSDNDDM